MGTEGHWGKETEDVALQIHHNTIAIYKCPMPFPSSKPKNYFLNAYAQPIK